jgi:predicted Ser/Thr protein kinase
MANPFQITIFNAMPQPAKAQMIGTVLSGRYRIESKLGSGGMSTVYLARDETLDRPVAIKMMHREISEQPDHLERFNQEARSVAKVSHPNVVTVIDAGEDAGRPYIVLEYVEGETLKQRIRREGPLDSRDATAIAIEIARGLAVAHARRLVHRDIKPQNVLIEPSGRAKLTDFGISRQLEQDGMTATGRVVGTTDYVSPEQALGKSVDPRSDIYSLGIVLFEMLTGNVPFEAESQVGVAMKHVTENLPDVQEIRPDVSAALALVVDKATTKDPAERYPHIGAMIEDLETALEVEAARAGGATGEVTTILDSLPEPRRRLSSGLRWSWTGFILLLAVAAITIIVVAIVSSGNSPVGKAPTTTKVGQGVPLVGATDFDPVGGDGEHPDELATLTDGNPAQTGGTWSTETYEVDFPATKPGVGVYVTARRAVAATDLEVRSIDPGWNAEIYASNEVPATLDPADPLAGWSLVGRQDNIQRLQQIPLDTAGQSFSHYLIWITKLAPTDDGNRVEITEIRLFE